VISNELKAIEKKLKRMLLESIRADCAEEVQQALMQAKKSIMDAWLAWDKYYSD
jgi:hypothetical protein